MRLFRQRILVSVAAICLFAVGAVAAQADGSLEVLISTLSTIAQDKEQSVDVRCEALRTLLVLEAENVSLAAGISGDKIDDMDVRICSLPNLCLSGSTDSTVKSTLATILADKTDSATMRARAVQTAANSLDLAVSELDDDIWTICSDTTDDASVRKVAVRVLSADADASGVQTLSGIMTNSQDDVAVRLCVLRNLRGRTESTYVLGLRTLLTAEVSVPADFQAVAQYTLFDKTETAYKLRLTALLAMAEYTGNEDVLSDLRTIAADSSENWPERLAAISILRNELDTASVVSTLNAVARNGDNTDQIRMAAVWNICRDNSATAYSLVCDLTANSEISEDLRESAFAQLRSRIPRDIDNRLGPECEAWSDCSAAASVLLDIAEDAEETMAMREKSVEALMYATDSGALAALRTFAQDETVADNLRIIAIEGLAKDSGSVAVLTAIVADAEDSQAVRDAAAAILGE